MYMKVMTCRNCGNEIKIDDSFLDMLSSRVKMNRFNIIDTLFLCCICPDYYEKDKPMTHKYICKEEEVDNV